MDDYMNERKLKKERSRHGLKNKKTVEGIDILHTKDVKDLDEDYDKLLGYIEDHEIDQFTSIINNQDNKFYLVHNDLDYNLFRHSVKLKEIQYIDIMEKNGYKFNYNMLLIELYDKFIYKKFKEKEPGDAFTFDDIKFLITFDNGRLIEADQCLLEFYFLLLSNEYPLATILLSSPYASSLQEDLNQMFIGDENNLLEQILTNSEIIKCSIKLALKRELDGVAYEIFTFSGIFLDEELMRCAVANDCSLFLEDVWESSRKFGNVRNFYAPKIGFSKYIECMLSEKKFEMASDAIKNWYEAYKEENIFETILLQKCEDLAIDLIETASTYNYRIDFDETIFNSIIKECYFLLKVILGKPMYKKFVNSEQIQKNLVDALRKGQTILPAIECYNAIEEHLLSIEFIEHAGKVLLDFLKTPKNFTFCRYPLMLCCLVAEFMIKLKRRFTVYESFFHQIYLGFLKAGELFAQKIKDPTILQYHLYRKDIKNRTCLQVMAQNRLYSILKVDYIGGIIEKNWNGNSILYGLRDVSSFTYMMRYDTDRDMYHLRSFLREYTKEKQFWFNFYSYQNIPSIRYFFKEFYSVILVGLYQTLIYFAVIDQNLEHTIDGQYYFLSRLVYIGSLAMALNKINSMVFFAYVSRWYIEVDPLIHEVLFILSIFLHWFNFKQFLISDTDEYAARNKELANAILLSFQFTFLWWKVIDSLKATKTYGGFLRTIFVLFRKMFLLVVFFYCFILLCSGIFNLLFHQTQQFQSYFNTFFFLSQAALQQYSIDPTWNAFLNFTLIVFMGICTLVLMNLIIALATRIYDEADDDILPEHRGNLVKLNEYLDWDESFGIFKFLFAPLNLIQFPFSVFILFIEDKKYWTRIFTRILYFPVVVLYFLLFIIVQLYKCPLAFIHHLFVYPFKHGFSFKRLLVQLLLGPFIFLYYFFRDLIQFWYYAYRSSNEMKDDSDNSASKILEFRKIFSNLIGVVSERVDNEKRLKRFWIPELVQAWLASLVSGTNSSVLQDVNNRMHKRTLIIRKYKTAGGGTKHIGFNLESISRNSHASMFKSSGGQVSILEQFKKFIEFLFKFADKEAFIDKDLAKNIFPKKNYYDDDYFEFLYYFNFKYFKNIIDYFTKLTNEIKKDMNKLRGVYMDFLKINEKFKKLRFDLKNHKFSKDDIKTLGFGISSINTIFAGLENNLNDAQAKEIFEKIAKHASNNAHRQAQTSSLQNQEQRNNIDKLHDFVGNK